MRTALQIATGPLISAGLAAFCASPVFDVDLLPYLPPLFVCITACAAVIGGAASAMLTILISTVALFLMLGSEHRDTELRALLPVVTAAASLATLRIVTLLSRRITEASQWESQRNAPARRLAAGLDRMDIGVVLLDRDTRAEFINKAYRRIFDLPDSKADRAPPLIALMYHGRDTRAYRVSDDQLDAFIAQQTELVRSGNAVTDLRMSDGTYLRLICTALPDGGRMLTYTPVSDAIRDQDDPAQQDAYLGMRGRASVDTKSRLTVYSSPDIAPTNQVAD